MYAHFDSNIQYLSNPEKPINIKKIHQDILVTRLYICAASPLFLQNLHSRPGIVGGGDGGCPGGGAVNIGGGERVPPPRAWPGPGKER